MSQTKPKPKTKLKQWKPLPDAMIQDQIRSAGEALVTGIARRLWCIMDLNWRENGRASSICEITTDTEEVLGWLGHGVLGKKCHPGPGGRWAIKHAYPSPHHNYRKLSHVIVYVWDQKQKEWVWCGPRAVVRTQKGI